MDSILKHFGTHVFFLYRQNPYLCQSQRPAPLDIIRKLAIALSVSSDVLIFDDAERGPDDELRLQAERGPDDELRLQFEAVSQFTAEEKKVAKVLLESVILKHDSSRFSAAG